MGENKINEVMDTTMNGIREMIDVNTIVGNPITTPDGTTVIPISKVSFGFASGGTDFGKQPEKQKFGGGSGAGVSIVPVAFLTITSDGVKVVAVDSQETGIEKAIQSVPTVVEKVSKILGTKKNSKKTAAADILDKTEE